MSTSDLVSPGRVHAVWGNLVTPFFASRCVKFDQGQTRQTEAGVAPQRLFTVLLHLSRPHEYCCCWTAPSAVEEDTAIGLSLVAALMSAFIALFHSLRVRVWRNAILLSFGICLIQESFPLNGIGAAVIVRRTTVSSVTADNNHSCRLFHKHIRHFRRLLKG